jgi:hypothetical protein
VPSDEKVMLWFALLIVTPDDSVEAELVPALFIAEILNV